MLYRGNYSEALGHYERALVAVEGAGLDHGASCRGGIARCAIRCGDYRRGIGIATEHGASRQLRQQCAEILEQTKVYVCTRSKKNSKPVNTLTAKVRVLVVTMWHTW